MITEEGTQDKWSSAHVAYAQGYIDSYEYQGLDVSNLRVEVPVGSNYPPLAGITPVEGVGAIYTWAPFIYDVRDTESLDLGDFQ